ncbi:hypothetical protein [Martelella mediterranea]|uniref:Uncharacterized protein n=1 Tax=Martelella mediterranea DSM 17316 TaxID=1122214 RepID=A0A1U9Z2Q0_9HYPH|nr:hypothetical protein [Martelella mediterranea]AQZ51930.1 hypothetical protein Mame_02604 [Martelella mediterranea DSM 17316]
MGDPIPANLEPYVAVLGEELAITFFLNFGGAPAYLSENPHSSSNLSQVIGPDKVKALAETLGVGHLYRVPINRRWLARAMKDKGYSVLAIARALHVSDVTVRSYLKDEDKRQLSFFDQD